MILPTRLPVPLLLLSLSLSLSIVVGGCGSDSQNSASRMSVRIDGSSTVFPISQAVAEEFRTVRPDVRVVVSYSGTGGGVQKMIAGEIDICGASRKMKPTEIEACVKRGIEVFELVVAFDGLAIVVNPENDWCPSLTVEELKNIWRPESDGVVVKWSDVRPDWPAEELKLYGPGFDSGTFDYFTEVICGEEKASRPDYTASENDNALVRGVAADRGTLGYFGLAYYTENKDVLKLVAVDGGNGPVLPSEETVRDGTYQPLSRPLFIYVRKGALERPGFVEFLNFYLAETGRLSRDVGYIPMSSEESEQNAKTMESVL